MLARTRDGFRFRPRCCGIGANQGASVSKYIVQWEHFLRLSQLFCFAKRENAGKLKYKNPSSKGLVSHFRLSVKAMHDTAQCLRLHFGGHRNVSSRASRVEGSRFLDGVRDFYMVGQSYLLSLEMVFIVIIVEPSFTYSKTSRGAQTRAN